jgi:hypothetical protein
VRDDDGLGDGVGGEHESRDGDQHPDPPPLAPASRRAGG